MLNKVILVGRMCTDPELKYTPSGVAVANFRIAVDRPFKNAQGEKETDFIDVVAWRHTADFVNTYIKKGQLMFVEGVLQVRQWQTPDGQKRRQAEVVAENLRALDRPREREEGAAVGTSTAGHYTPRPQQSTGGNGMNNAQTPRDNYSMPEDVPEYNMPDISDPFDDQ